MSWIYHEENQRIEVEIDLGDHHEEVYNHVRDNLEDFEDLFPEPEDIIREQLKADFTDQKRREMREVLEAEIRAELEVEFQERLGEEVLKSVGTCNINKAPQILKIIAQRITEKTSAKAEPELEASNR